MLTCRKPGVATEVSSLWAFAPLVGLGAKRQAITVATEVSSLWALVPGRLHRLIRQRVKQEFNSTRIRRRKR
jgi:uncharacterized membrane protein (DUF4010 family)